MSEEKIAESTLEHPTHEELNHIARALRGLRFGSVNIIVQDGFVVQVEKTEKHRLRNRGEALRRNC